MVEVVLALAVLAIGVLGVIGMLPNALTSSRSAADNTLGATIVQDTFNTIRSQPFTAVKLDSLGFPTTAYDLRVNQANVFAYFDQSGLTPAKPPEDNYYKVTLNCVPQGTLPVTLITATLTWPDKGPGAAVPPNTNTFFTEVANYQ